MIQLTGLSQLTLRVNNLQRAEDFYTGVLGMTVHHRLGINMTYLDCNGDKLVLVRAETPSPKQARDIRIDHFGFRLETDKEVDSAAAFFKENGVHLLTPPSKRKDGRAFFILDPDGNMIEIYSSDGTVFEEEDPSQPPKRRGRKSSGKTPVRKVPLTKRRRSRK
jgi:catechol 2,3-dioxygenase-like lactoylglutathione lyase family enzyme